MMREIKIRAKPDKACFFEPDSVSATDKERKNHGFHELNELFIN